MKIFNLECLFVLATFWRTLMLLQTLLVHQPTSKSHKTCLGFHIHSCQQYHVFHPALFGPPPYPRESWKQLRLDAPGCGCCSPVATKEDLAAACHLHRCKNTTGYTAFMQIYCNLVQMAPRSLKCFVTHILSNISILFEMVLCNPRAIPRV